MYAYTELDDEELEGEQKEHKTKKESVRVF